MARAVADFGRYAYAVTRGLADEGLAEVSGIGGARVEVVRHLGLDAVVSDVPLAEFGEQGLKENLESLTWLEGVARAHDDVVRAVAALGPTAPMRLATIFLDDDAVQQRLVDLHGDLTDVLDRVEGRGEWSVKVVAPPAAPAAAAPEPTSGAEFLRRRKAETSQREQRQTDVARVADDIHAALADRAVASRLLPPQDPQLTGESGTMILNGAYLVAAQDHAGFEELIRELGRQQSHVTVAGAGPWPPYSFAVLEPS